MTSPTIDPRLEEWATETQKKYLAEVNRVGSLRKAAANLGVGQSTLRHSIAGLKKRAAREGYAPGHFEAGVAPGYSMGKVTIQRSAAGVERVWERQLPDQTAAKEFLRISAEAMADKLERLDPIAKPEQTDQSLCNLFTLTDCHVGMLAWRNEGGADWDLKIAERTLVGCFEHLVRAAPRAKIAVVNQLGDFMHSDGLLPITPTSHHVLDQDGRYSKMVAVAIRTLRRIVDTALTTHDEVHLIIAEGNHDLSGAVWLRQMFMALYEKEPRLTVNNSELPYYGFSFGATFLGFHHGHMKKNDQLPILFASQFPEMWGTTKHRFAHTGHRHHVEEKEHSGMTVIQHPTLAARDAYAARGGWIAARSATAITYHEQFGQVARNTVSPEMIAA